MISGYRTKNIVLALLVWLAGHVAAEVSVPMQLLQGLDDFPHAQQIEFMESDVLDYEVGLGAIQKFSGDWNFKRSERFDGILTSYTWLLDEGFTSFELMNDLLIKLDELKTEALMFGCDGRACGNGVEWANRAFHQPVLYGRADMQRYRVYSIGQSPRYLLLIYAAARTSHRQYLHTVLLQVKKGD